MGRGAPPQEAPVGLYGLAPGVLTPTLPASSEPGSRFFQAYANKGTLPGGSMGEELSGEVGRERRVGAAPSSLRFVVQSSFQQPPCRGALVNTHFGFGAWTHTARLSPTGRLVLRVAGAWGWEVSRAGSVWPPAPMPGFPFRLRRRDAAGPVHTHLFFSVLMSHFYHKNKTVGAG